MWLAACGPLDPGVHSPECAADPPGLGQVRAKQIVCASEIASGGEAKIGDWLLENSRVRIAIRGQPNRLTRLTGGGGTVIDAEVLGGGDGLVEIAPLGIGDWPERTLISAENETISVRADDGSGRTWTYELNPDTGELQIKGAEGFSLVPEAGSELVGEWVHGPNGLVIAADDRPEDLGGWLNWAGTSVWFGTSRTVTTDRFSGVQTGQFSTQASHVEFRINGALFTRQPTDSSTLEHEFPVGTEVRGVTPGHAPTDWVDAASSGIPALGTGGFLELLPIAPRGRAIGATVEWNGSVHWVGPTGGLVPVGPGTGSGWITSGPEYTPYEIPFASIDDQVSLAATLEPIGDDAAWIAFGVESSPGPFERSRADQSLERLGANGVEYAVLIATDEVAKGSQDPESIPHHAGSRSGGPQGTVWAWPWTPNSKEAAHGAAPWSELNDTELLAWMSKAGRRYTAVDAQWIEQAGSISALTHPPDLLYLRSPNDLAAAVSLYDRWIDIALVGPNAWVDTDKPWGEDILRALLEGRSAPSTGPKLALTVDGHGPGERASTWPRTPSGPMTAELSVEHPGDVTTIQLIGSAGTVVGSWEPEELPVSIELPDLAWVLATAEGETDWTVTSPVWMRRP